MVKMKKYEFYINGHYSETYKTLEEAQRALAREKRIDENEVKNEGYKPIKVDYKIVEV